MVSSAAICDAGAPEPRLWAVHGAVRAAAVGHNGSVRTFRESRRDRSNSETRKGYGIDCRAAHARWSASRNGARDRGAWPDGTAGEKSQVGKRPEILA